MTLDEFQNALSDLGQSIEDTPSALVQIGERIVSQMRVRVPVDTGALQRSISYAVTGDSLEFSMLYYGAFQNYGVKGLAGPLTNPVPFGVNPQPLRPPFYAFRDRSFGISPQPFYDYEEITNLVLEAIENNLEQ